MSLPESSRLQFVPGHNICRILNGLWQVAGGYGRVNTKAAVQEMSDYHDAGFTTWDLADHYGPAEDFIGEFRSQLRQSRGSDSLERIKALAKWVPWPGRMTRHVVGNNIAVSLRRMDVETLEIL